MGSRIVTNKVIEMAEEGLISWADLCFMTLKWMSEDDVVEMCKANDIRIEDEVE